MAKSTVGVCDFNTRITSEMSNFMPGCDFVCNLNSTAGKTLSEAMAIAQAFVGLGSPFRCVIQNNCIWIDATDKTKIPYAALQAAMGMV